MAVLAVPLLPEAGAQTSEIAARGLVRKELFEPPGVSPREEEDPEDGGEDEQKDREDQEDQGGQEDHQAQP